jgi:4-hydroxy-tetrahydrodipicolinate synthase
MATPLCGVFAALVTPMTRSGQFDRRTLARLIDHLIGEGIHGLVPLGSTGEFYALTHAERDAVLETTFRAAAKRVPVVVGATAAATAATIRNCRHAERLGASAVLLAAPYYAVPTPDELVEHFRAVNNAIGIPIMLYNCPGRTRVDMTPPIIERLAKFSNVRYVKESSGDVTRTGEIIRRCGKRITVFCGSDGEALSSFALGSAGWVSGAANFLGGPLAALYNTAVCRKDYGLARRLFYKLLPTLSLLEGEGKYGQFTKAACALVGWPVGEPRQPCLPATKDEIRRLKKAIRLVTAGRDYPTWATSGVLPLVVDHRPRRVRRHMCAVAEH